MSGDEKKDDDDDDDDDDEKKPSSPVRDASPPPAPHFEPVARPPGYCNHSLHPLYIFCLILCIHQWYDHPSLTLTECSLCLVLRLGFFGILTSRKPL